MRIITLILLFAFSACNNKTLLSNLGYKAISKEYQDRNKLIERIIPSIDCKYWEYVHFTPHLIKNKARIIWKSGDTSIRNNFTFYPQQNGFFTECLPGICYSYIAYIKNDDVFYIIDEIALKKFIGKIDNFEEAILIAKINDLWFDANDLKGGAYKETENGYELYMMKYNMCPETKESIKVQIDSMGNFKSQNQGIYFKSKNCIMN